MRRLAEKLRAEELAEEIIKHLQDFNPRAEFFKDLKTYSCESTWVRNKKGYKYYYWYLKGRVFPFSIYIPEELLVICEVIDALRTGAIYNIKVREELAERISKALVELRLSKLAKSDT